MTVFERIQGLAKKRGIAVSRLAITLGFSENLFYRWKTSEPKAKDLEKVAEYFNVSVDYLLGRTDNPNMSSADDIPMSKQVMMRMDTDGLSEQELDEIESEMERFFKWRLEEIKREREEEK